MQDWSVFQSVLPRPLKLLSKKTAATKTVDNTIVEVIDSDSENEEKKNKLVLSVFAREIEFVDEDESA